MRKTLAVFKREYLQAVRKKMFIIMTVLLPVLMSAAFLLPALVMMKGLGEKKIAVLDGTGEMREAFNRVPLKRPSRALPGGGDSEMIKIEYSDRRGDTGLEQTAKPYFDRMTSSQKEGGGINGVLLIPPDALESDKAHLRYYSRSSTDIMVQERLSSITNRGLQRYRLNKRGVSGDDLDRIMTQVPVDGVQLSKTGEQKKGGAGNFFAGIIFAALLMIPSFVYGLEIMRGIIQEKSDRVVEVLISSMHPTQLLTGKILGVAAVGLTQIGAWIVMMSVIAAFGAISAAMSGFDLSQFLRASTFVYFFIFFILAYLTYVCVYAIGGAACNSDKEAQQLIAPITMVMMLPWFMIGALVTNPDSKFVTGLSMAPVFGPLTMFVRTLVSDPPMSQILLSIVVSIATVTAFLYATAKIFRVGILSYGKRPTLPELWRWLKVA